MDNLASTPWDGLVTGIHLASYGRESGESLIDAIRVVHDTEGVLRVRLGSLEPLVVTDEFCRALREMPADVRHALGLELMTVQFGGEPSDFKPMPSVGAGAYEIRYRDTANGAFRVMYVAKFADAVYVLHAFQKKTQKTAKYDIDLAAKRYKMIGA